MTAPVPGARRHLRRPGVTGNILILGGKETSIADGSAAPACHGLSHQERDLEEEIV